MSRYDWPGVGRGVADDDDDPRARARFTQRRRVDFDLEGALAAGRRAVAPPSTTGRRTGRRRPGQFAPATGRQHLWQPLGPMTVVTGQTVGRSRIAGRVNALAVHTAGNRVYAASANGGVWYSSDGGVHWKSLGGLAPTVGAEVNRPAQRHACGSILVSFGATEATDTVYVGTGETTHAHDAQPGHSLAGIGVLVGDHPATSADPNPWIREAKNLLGEGICRLAVQPSGTTVVAATTAGLFERPAGGGLDCVWSKVAGTPFGTLTDKCSDVLWTAGAGARPERLWVWVQDGASAGLWVRDAGQTNFTSIATAGSMASRAVITAATPPDQIFVFNDQGAGALGTLYRVATASAAAPVASPVTAGVPNILGTQGFYDIGIAVHPTLPNRVVLVGSTFPATSPDGVALQTSGADDGAVIAGDVALNGAILTFGQPAPPTMIGVGVHSDVHDVAYSNNGNTLWVSCDGGVYRSDRTASQVGFFAVNDGLSVIESNYIAVHPTCEGNIVAGLQDNGMITRRSNSVWTNAGLGDGGGVGLDPLTPTRFFRQHHNGIWSSSDGTFSVATVAGEKAAFYSMPAAIGHRRAVVAPAAPDVGQIIVGTRRVWYSENFGGSWVTLPNGNPPPAGNLSQDDFEEKVTVCRWQSPDVAWILSEGKLMRYVRTAGSDAVAGPGTWTAEPTIRKGVKNKKDATPAEGPIRDSIVWTDIAVNLDPPPGANQPPAVHGTKGAVYLGTIGKPDDTDVDTLWWFDGTSKWFKTGLRADTTGVPAPVTALVCDPDHPEEVFVGTTVGVWRGVRTQVGGADPAWTWSPRVNGLPEAAVEDLAIFSNGGVRLLRAAIASRGIWELRLDVADVADVTYVRANDDDLRYRARAIEVQRDLTTARSWHGSPDVRPRRAPLAPAHAPPGPAPALPWSRATAGIDAEVLRRFQSALRARTGDPRVRPTGSWDMYFNEVLRDLGGPILPSPPAAANTVGIDTAFWNLNVVAPHSTAEPWGAGTPTEADLYDFVASLTEGDLTATSCSLPKNTSKVDIVVHHRGLDPVDGANVRVTLLRWISPTRNTAMWNDQTTWFAGSVPWTPAVNQVLNSADGKTPTALTAGWSFVLGTAAQSHRVTLAGQTLDPTTSGVATFDLDLSGIKANTIVLLVAVIRAGTAPADDIALAPATVENLALTSPNVAVRSLRVTA